MTPHAMAKAECANWDQGRCLASDLQETCSLSRKPPEACVYFSRAVLPLADMDVGDRRRQRAYRKARDAYHAMFDEVAPTRKCRDCGAPLPQNAAPTKLYCAACGKRRYRNAVRDGVRRYRTKAWVECKKSVAANPHKIRAEIGDF